MTGRVALAGAMLAACAGGAASQETAPVDSLAAARQYTEWLYAGEADSLVAHSTEEARQGFSTVEGWNRLADQISSNAGIELAVIEETWKLRNGDCQYYRVGAFSGFEGGLLIRWILTKDGRISGVGVGPADRAPPFDREDCSPP